MMFMMRNFLLIPFLIGGFSVHAQQQLGMRLERRAGLYALEINPAAAAFTPAKWEISLFSADVFVNQNYGRFLNTSVPKVLREPELVKLLSDLREDPNAESAIPLDFYNKGRAFGLVQTRIAGPGFLFRLNDRHTFGLSGALRFNLSSYRVPELLRYNSVSNFAYGTTYNIDPVKVTAMGWSEIAGHYTYSNFDGDILFSAGISPKFLSGYQSVFTNVNADFNYTPIVSDTSNIGSANWDYGFTTDILYADQPENATLTTNGRGAGVDLGFSWAMPLEDAENPNEYQWRAGVSLMDAGFIRFNKNAEKHAIDFNNLSVVAGDTIANALNNGVEEGVREISRVLLGDPNASLVDTKYTIGLPTVLSAQFDYAFTPHFYVGAVATQRIPLSKHTLRTANTLAIVPRFEHRWFSVSLPLVLSDYRSPRLGVAARLGYLYFGSDDITSWTGKKNLTGTDFYIGLKIHGFPVHIQKRHKSRGGLRARDRRWKDVGCFNQ
jgi:Family of unknown function (DUF5723)